MNLQRGSRARRLIAMAIVAGIFAFRWYTADDRMSPRGSARPPAGATAATSTNAEGIRTILDAYASQRSGVWVQAMGTVERHLPDDNEGDRHQRLIVRLTPDHTVLISHNIDLADRTAAAVGDDIAFRGRYEWNDRGGVVHWTHHDPKRGLNDFSRGGWLRADDVTVR